MDQAKVLTSFVSFLNASGKCCTVTQKVREASSGVSDSDDEEVPDPAISPAFTDSELLAVQMYYEKLCSAFRSAVVRQFTNVVLHICIFVSGYARHKCVKRPPPREGYNYYFNLLKS